MHKPVRHYAHKPKLTDKMQNLHWMKNPWIEHSDTVAYFCYATQRHGRILRLQSLIQYALTLLCFYEFLVLDRLRIFANNVAYNGLVENISIIVRVLLFIVFLFEINSLRGFAANGVQAT